MLCGLVAWWRRPGTAWPAHDRRGFVNFLTSLAWTTSDLTHTVGQALDLVPPVLFLHVFLAYPTGRLNGRFERVLVLTGYATAISLELVRMFLGGFGPLNLLEVTSAPDAAATITRVQLSLVAAFCLTGVAIPRRPPLARGPAAATFAGAPGRCVRARAPHDRNAVPLLVSGGPVVPRSAGRPSSRSVSLRSLS